VHYIVLAACFNTLITGHLHTRKTGARPTKDSCILCLGRLLVVADPKEAARSAAHLYARCRWAGVTPRSANDYLIATHAILGGMPLLHRDRDFGLIAGAEPKLILVAANG
jgi:predicted nucleic acid-binding protein